MAAQSVMLQELVHEKEGKIVILIQEKESIKRNLSEEIRVISEENTALREKYTAQETISISHQEENKALKKQIRRARWQRNGAVLIGLLIIGLSL
jgi:hypothetical protein